MYAPVMPLSGIVAENDTHVPPVVVSAPSVIEVFALHDAVVAFVVPYFTTVFVAANCAYVKLISIALQPDAPVETRITGSSLDESSLSALPVGQKFEPVIVAPDTHHSTRNSPLM
jgi:hypothetical protein